MKRAILIVHEPRINKVVGRELDLSLESEASLVDAINEVDALICSKGSFPVPDYQSLLHMVYNPCENRFYSQVAVSACSASGQSLNVRADPTKVLPAGTTVTLIPAGGCISEWEEVLDYSEFLKGCRQG